MPEVKSEEVSRSFVPPERFNFEARDWPVWKQRFQRYRRLTKIEHDHGEKQIDALIYSMGEKADEIFSSFNLNEADSRKYEKVIEAFDAYFVGKRNIVYDRARFQMRRQEEGEPFESFETALHTLADYCNYGDLKEELIRDRIVVGVRDGKLSERLMLIDNLDLARAKEICKQWEAVKRQHEDLNGSAPASSALLNEVKKSRECKFCNRRHEWTKEKCPAFGKTCAKCGGKDHFAVCCNAETQNVGPVRGRQSGLNAVSSTDWSSDLFLG